MQYTKSNRIHAEVSGSYKDTLIPHKILARYDEIALYTRETCVDIDFRSSLARYP